jgi:hypothetical protein
VPLLRIAKIDISLNCFFIAHALIFLSLCTASSAIFLETFTFLSLSSYDFVNLLLHLPKINTAFILWFVQGSITQDHGKDCAFIGFFELQVDLIVLFTFVNMLFLDLSILLLLLWDQYNLFFIFDSTGLRVILACQIGRNC